MCSIWFSESNLFLIPCTVSFRLIRLYYCQSIIDASFLVLGYILKCALILVLFNDNQKFRLLVLKLNEQKKETTTTTTTTTTNRIYKKKTCSINKFWKRRKFR